MEDHFTTTNPGVAASRLAVAEPEDEMIEINARVLLLQFGVTAAVVLIVAVLVVWMRRSRR